MDNRRENFIQAVIIFIILLVARGAYTEKTGFLIEDGAFSLKIKVILLAIREIPIWLFDFFSFPLLIIYFVITFLKPSNATLYNITMSYLISTFLLILIFVITKQIESIDLNNKFYGLTGIIIISSIFILLIPEKKNTLS